VEDGSRVGTDAGTRGVRSARRVRPGGRRRAGHAGGSPRCPGAGAISAHPHDDDGRAGRHHRGCAAEWRPGARRRLRQREGAAAGVAGDQGLDVISLSPGTKVFLACHPVDLRNGFDGLAAKVKQMIGADPFSGHLFLFRGKRGDYLKALYWDGTGLCLFAKRLEKGRFVWPPIVDGGVVLTPAQLALLIEAMDWRRTVAPPSPTQPMLV